MKYKITLKSGKEIDVEFAAGVKSPLENYIEFLNKGTDLSRVVMTMGNAAGVPYFIVNLGEVAAIEARL